MNKILLTITAALLMIVMPAKATNYEDIRNYALFLTDKMAYELNLSEEQYEAAYEINFDYLCDILKYDDYDDLYGHAWRLRNRDLKFILMEAQYNLFANLNYFYRPCYFSHGRISISIYNYYPRRDYLYFGCPNFVVTYRGGHGWRHHRHHSYYAGRTWHRTDCYGMRDGYRDGRRYYHNSNGSSNRGWRLDRHHDDHRGSMHRGYDRDCRNGFRGSRGNVSSTRTTVNNRSEGFGKSRGSVSNDRRLPDSRFSPRKAGEINRGGSVSVNRSNRSSVNRGSSSSSGSYNRPSRANVNRSNSGSSLSRSSRSNNVSRSDRSRSNNNSRNNNSRGGGFGGGR